MKMVIAAEAVADMSGAAGVAWTYTPTVAGKLFLKQCFVVYEEAVAAGGFSTTTPVIDIEASGTQLATHSPDLTNGQSVGDQENLTVNTTNVTVDNGVYEYAADTDLTFEVNTQGAGGTTTGTARLYLVVDENRG